MAETNTAAIASLSAGNRRIYSQNTASPVAITTELGSRFRRQYLHHVKTAISHPGAGIAPHTNGTHGYDGLLLSAKAILGDLPIIEYRGPPNVDVGRSIHPNILT